MSANSEPMSRVIPIVTSFHRKVITWGEAQEMFEELPDVKVEERGYFDLEMTAVREMHGYPAE